MYIADLHIHSRYSRATSKDCTPEYLDLWARKKGIDLVGTGDFTHPVWREELKEKLEPAEEGLYVLKEEYRLRDESTPDGRRPRFIVTGEISSIYKKKDRVRKVHSLLLLPGLEDADSLARRLELIGNIHSDGRPILGLDCRDLLEIMLETCPAAVYVPAHIWTPHFSLFGAFSGFDRIRDCYEDLTPYIYALETGLSSDPPMNWRVSALDSYRLISNSDAHSPAKLGREATLFEGEFSFGSLEEALRTGKGLAGTLEFFPEEGKYHLDGHRKCGLCLEPGEAAKYGNICPVCGKKLTIGVLHRVEELADCEEGRRAPAALPFESIAPLPEVIAASTGAGAAGKKVQEQYGKMLHSLGDEFSILRSIPVEDIRKAAGPLIAEGIRRLRAGEVQRTPGFDGAYGTLRLLSDSEISALEGQLCFFSEEELQAQEQTGMKNDPDGRQKDLPAVTGREGVSAESGEDAGTSGGPAGREKDTGAGNGGKREEWNLRNPQQQEAVEARERAVAVIAGPGAGKTRTLLDRLLYLLEEQKVKPGEITAVTFTNKAAEEMKSRLGKLPGGKRTVKQMSIGTFHAICSGLLSEQGISFSIADEGLQEELAARTKAEFGLKLAAGRFLRALSFRKSGLRGLTLSAGKEGGVQETVPVKTVPAGEKETKPSAAAEIPEEAFAFYQEQMREAGVFDYDDLLLETLRLFSESGEKEKEALGKRFTYLLVDEFQDINPIQYRLIQEWNRTGKELFVIGDPDQSIYGFRGSDACCFDRLQEDYPGLRIIELEKNYRSTPQIVSGALSVISHSGGRERKLQAVGPDGPRIRAVTAPDERSEAIFVAKEINRLIGGIDMRDVEETESRQGSGIRSFSDIAVLYRTHRQARLLEYCLRQEGIPYVAAGREDFLLEKQVRGALYFFQHVLHPEDPLAGRLALRLLWEAKEAAAAEQLGLLLHKYEKTVRKVKPVKLLESWAADRKLEEDEPIRKLTDMSVLYPSMEAFLHTLTFGEEGDIRRNGGRSFSADAVTLMTFHGSKGLEFPAVFLYGIRKGLVPMEPAGGDCDREEERRLFYVGMTRAGEELILTSSGEESAFIGEIAGPYLAREKTGKEKEVLEVMQLSLFDFKCMV